MLVDIVWHGTGSSKAKLSVIRFFRLLVWWWGCKQPSKVFPSYWSKRGNILWTFSVYTRSSVIYLILKLGVRTFRSIPSGSVPKCLMKDLLICITIFEHFHTISPIHIHCIVNLWTLAISLFHLVCLGSYFISSCSLYVLECLIVRKVLDVS